MKAYEDTIETFVEVFVVDARFNVNRGLTFGHQMQRTRMSVRPFCFLLLTRFRLSFSRHPWVQVSMDPSQPFLSFFLFSPFLFLSIVHISSTYVVSSQLIASHGNENGPTLPTNALTPMLGNGHVSETKGKGKG